jgi:hypothetical protein
MLYISSLVSTYTKFRVNLQVRLRKKSCIYSFKYVMKYLEII